MNKQPKSKKIAKDCTLVKFQCRDCGGKGSTEFPYFLLDMGTPKFDPCPFCKSKNVTVFISVPSQKPIPKGWVPATVEVICSKSSPRVAVHLAHPKKAKKLC